MTVTKIRTRSRHKVRRGQIVALETRHTTQFVIGSGKPSESYLRFCLVRVDMVSRKGEVLAIEARGMIGLQYLHALRAHNYAPRIHYIPTKQDEAERLLSKMSDDAVSAGWPTVELLKVAILAA